MPAAREIEDMVNTAVKSGARHFSIPKDRYAAARRNSISVISGLVMIVVIWWALAEVTVAFRGVSFPTPPQVFGRFAEALLGADIQGSTIYAQTFASLVRWGWGYLLAVGLGVTIGCVLGVSRSMHDLSIVAVYILQLIPGLAWIPIALLIFGLGEVSTIFMILMAALPPIIINTAGGIREAPPIYEKMTGMMEIGPFTKFWHVLIPASAISVINGLRIGLASSWRVLIAAEMIVGVALGLGYTIIQSRYDLDYESAFVSILVICIIGIVVEKLFFQVLEDRVRDRLGLERES